MDKDFLRLKVTGHGIYPSRFARLATLIGAMKRPVTVIAAGNQLGGDAYVLAMHLLDAGIADVRIIAHDAQADRQAIATRGVYRASEISIDFRMGRLSPHFREYYVPDTDDKYLSVRADVRGLIEFVPTTQMLPYEGVAPADVIMLRNVWLHLHPSERITLIARLRDSLPDDGVFAVRYAHWNELSVVAPSLGDRRVFGRPYPDAVQRLSSLELEPARDPLYADRPGQYPVA
ncbi:hypothetical protein OH799_19480 [Nocardia sp. NBC_00881]|uniref:CheR family methyltransferase n=1 Tax=Nocardia sp. NBC_00881 TaxID=2975995 RepID=UPI00386D3EA5|nr:hypothetical protein OH799_19480 [Nocardia sp. NBC_00881]